MNVQDMVRVFMMLPSGYAVICYVPPEADALDQARILVRQAAPRYASVDNTVVVDSYEAVEP